MSNTDPTKTQHRKLKRGATRTPLKTQHRKLKRGATRTPQKLGRGIDSVIAI
jgi:hypothetical protein